jgi:hypothetical protein
MATNKTTKTNKTDNTDKTSKSKCTCNCNHDNHDNDSAAELKSVKEVLEQIFGKITRTQCCDEPEAESETPRKKSISDLKLITAQDNAYDNDKSLVSFLLGGFTTLTESATNTEIPEEKISIDIVSLMAAIHDIYLHGVRDGYLRHQVKSFESLLSTDSAKILFKELASEDDTGSGCEDAADYNEKIDDKSAKSLIKLLALVHPVVKDEHLKDSNEDSEDTEDTEKSKDKPEETKDDKSSVTSVTTYQVKLTDAVSGDVVEVTASSQEELVAKINKLKDDGDIPAIVADKVISDVIKSDEDDEDNDDDNDNDEDNVEDKPTKQSKKFTKPTKPAKPAKDTKDNKADKSTKTRKCASDKQVDTSSLIDKLFDMF